MLHTNIYIYLYSYIQDTNEQLKLMLSWYHYLWSRTNLFLKISCYTSCQDNDNHDNTGVMLTTIVKMLPDADVLNNLNYIHKTDNRPSIFYHISQYASRCLSSILKSSITDIQHSKSKFQEFVLMKGNQKFTNL